MNTELCFSLKKQYKYETLVDIAQQFALHNVTCFFVGGCVRDELLGKESDDVDICLVGATKDTVTMMK